MKNKTLVIFGIGTYILSVITSATDLEGNFRFPIALIAISGIATIVFIVMETSRLPLTLEGIIWGLFTGFLLLGFRKYLSVFPKADFNF